MPDNAPNLDELLDAALTHVPFDGWSDRSFRAACADLRIGLEAGRALAPRGALDLAAAKHRRDDSAMLHRLEKTDLSALRFHERVATALKIRVGALGDREAVRRAATLFSLPLNAAEGAGLTWETADHVWNALGDTSRDSAWYTKRAMLAGVWSATLLYWLGDKSLNHTRTDAFIDRRVADVMRVEKLKARLRENPVTKPMMELQRSLFSWVRAPDPDRLRGLPGRWRRPG